MRGKDHAKGALNTTLGSTGQQALNNGGQEYTLHDGANRDIQTRKDLLLLRLVEQNERREKPHPAGTIFVPKPKRKQNDEKITEQNKAVF